MKRLIKILSVIIVLAVAVVVAGVAVLSSLDFNQYKGVLAEEVKKATGRDLKIAGDLKLEISLVPSLYVDGVSVSNASWGSRPEMLTLKRLEAEVALLPLLSSKVDVKRLILNGMDLLLETDKKGAGNWQVGGPAAGKEAGAGGGVLPVVRDVRMRDLMVTYKDGATGEQTKVRLASLDVAAAGTAAPLKIALKGTVNGQEVSADGTIASVAQLTAGGEFPLDLRISALGVKATAKGAIADLRNLTGIAVTLDASGDNLAATVGEAKKLVPGLAALSVPDLGPFSAKVTVTGTPKQLSLTNLDARLGRAGETELTAKGSIADALKPAGIKLDVAAKIKNPTALAKAVGAEIPPLPALDAQARVQDAPGGYGLAGIVLKLGNSDLQGSATARLGGARPSVTADLTSQLLDLDQLLPKPADKAPAGKPADDGRLFPADPLPLDALKAADAAIKLKAARVRVQGLDVTAVDLGLNLAGGKLAVKPLSAVVSDGKVSGEITLGGDQAVPPVKVDLRVDKLDIGKLQAALGEKPAVTGTADLRVDAAGAGTSVRQFMAGLDGTLRLVSEKGHIESALLNIASADVMSALPLVDSKGDKDLRCAVADFQIVKGIANAKALVAETGGLSVVGVGAINLRDETLNLVIEPRAKKTSLLSAALVPVAVRGTLAKPDPQVNPADLVTGVAGNVLSGAAAVATFGLSALAQSAFNRATSTDETDYCQQALAGKVVTPAKGQQGSSSAPAKQQAPAQQQQQKPAESLDKTLDNLGKGIGGGLKGLFGK